MSVTPLAYAFSTAAINSDFIGAMGLNHTSSLSAHRYKRWQFPSVMSHLSLNGESQMLSWNWSTEGGEACRAEKQKRKHEKKTLQILTTHIIGCCR